MTAPGPLSGAVSGNPAAPAHVNRNTARRVVPLFRPYRAQVATVVGGVQSVVTTTASTILANVVIFTSTIVAMVILSWQLTVVAVITVPAFFWLTKMVGERRRQVARSTQESLAAMSALSEETLSVSGVLLAKAFGNQARDTTRYHQENQRLADLEVRQQMIGQGFYAIVQSFLSITPAAVYLIAGLLLAHGTAISAGTVVAFTTLQTRLYFPIGQLLQVSVELRSSLALFDRIFEYLDVVPDIVDAPDAVDLPAISSGGQVALREVYFRYPGVPADALAGVSLEAGPGGLHPRPDHAVPRRLRDDRRRAGVPPVRRRKTATGHRAGPAARPAHPDPGRGNLRARHRQRTGGPAGPRRPHGVTDHHRHRPSPVHHRQRRRHQRHRRRARG